jgi:alpha-N-arabinofuranosidase
MEPVLGVYAGLSFQEPAVKAGPDPQPFVQDALDEIEYASGGPETTWEARRTRDGPIPRPSR